jgi:hypothetical protein
MRIHRRITLAIGSGALVLAAMAGPAAAAAPSIDRSTDSWTVQHDCGIVEETTVTVTSRDFFDGATWLRSVVTFDFVGTYTGPSGSFTSESHQAGIFTPTTGAINGQGTFLRPGGQPILMDVGRLVFAIPDGSTIQSSDKAVSFDDPDAGTRLEAALCARIG